MLKAICILIVGLMLNGCAVNQVSTRKSELDGTVYVNMTPTYALDNVAVGLSWNDKLPYNAITLEVIKMYGGVIAPGQSLHFNIDGDLISLSSIDAIPKVGISPAIGYHWASLRYSVPPEFLKKMVTARKIVVRVDMDREFVEGVLLEGPGTMKAVVPDFLKAYEVSAKRL